MTMERADMVSPVAAVRGQRRIDAMHRAGRLVREASGLREQRARLDRGPISHRATARHHSVDARHVR